MNAFRLSNRTVAVVVALFAGVYLAGAYRLPDFVAVDVPVQPATLPRGLGFVLLGLAVVLFFQRSTPLAEQPEQASEGPAGEGTAAAGQAGTGGLGRLGDIRLELGLFAAASAAYVALFTIAGFVLATAAYLAAMVWYLGYRRHLVTALVSIGIPLVTYLGMTEGLGVVLPNGPLPF
ncbi:tripartite tricarboxylate transporter TctB family protein [Haloechinothrix sp. LS1_15]|uniref:tripartite tricarboxylate transporter TctB family protein n=1 Tax=Haloechinothrix sp. LS1_15 TaxID=2652248 RepID=UPI002946D026|nr:tripartite tricarboxylate transporter TctB family protein [Haloechinothrix sp. LS1_15]MDV6012995.1 tripartite tricarboxylate transporter TctB family protein [Haloechinothrix sp. LS1_15]